jgi:4-hydroxybenzoyl-CoA reductase subunit beta
MMRLPHFTYHAPRSLQEAVDLLARGDAMVVAGGTDLLPNMKRRQQVPRTLIGLRGLAELRHVRNDDGVTIGAGVTLAEIVRDARLSGPYASVWQAASQVATPHLRNMGTIGGNLCLDTRCNYYDQSYEWRKAIDFCMKKDERATQRGTSQVCWVATSSPRCLAVSSTDTAPALVALGATVTLTAVDGVRTIPLTALYQNDGIEYLTRRPDEILTDVHLPRLEGWRSTYWKLRRRGSFDFPVLGVAAAAKLTADGTVEASRIVLGAVASRPLESSNAALALVGKRMSDDVISAAAEIAAHAARPMDNTDYTLHWRKRVTRELVIYALRELRGDDTRELRRKLARVEMVARIE